METPLPLDLGKLVEVAKEALTHQGVHLEELDEPLLAFLFDRLRGLLRDAGYAQEVIEAVLAQRPTRIDLIPLKLDAVRSFLNLPEALALAAANKRIGNILKKAEGALPKPNPALLQDDAEKALYDKVQAIAPLVTTHVASENYADALKALASVRSEVDQFFDKVMVNVDDPALRGNRLGLLKALFDQLNAVADISKLGV